MAKKYVSSDEPSFAAGDIEIWFFAPYDVSNLHHRARGDTEPARVRHRKRSEEELLEAEIAATWTILR